MKERKTDRKKNKQTKERMNTDESKPLWTLSRQQNEYIIYFNQLDLLIIYGKGFY